MKEFDIFLRALEERLGFKKGYFGSRKYSIPNSKFPAYKELTFEVWHIDKNETKLISRVQSTKKEINEEEAEQNKRYLLKETYKNMLSFYGI